MKAISSLQSIEKLIALGAKEMLSSVNQRISVNAFCRNESCVETVKRASGDRLNKKKELSCHRGQGGGKIGNN